jgi:hypothetical protein
MVTDTFVLGKVMLLIIVPIILLSRFDRSFGLVDYDLQLFGSRGRVGSDTSSDIQLQPTALNHERSQLLALEPGRGVPFPRDERVHDLMREAAEAAAKAAVRSRVRSDSRPFMRVLLFGCSLQVTNAVSESPHEPRGLSSRPGAARM